MYFIRCLLCFCSLCVTAAKEPPYKLQESGYGSFILPIDIYFRNKEEPRQIRFDYDLFLHLNGNPPVNHVRCELLTFQNPTDDFRQKLLKAGGVSVGRGAGVGQGVSVRRGVSVGLGVRVVRGVSVGLGVGAVSLSL